MNLKFKRVEALGKFEEYITFTRCKPGVILHTKNSELHNKFVEREGNINLED